MTINCLRAQSHHGLQKPPYLTEPGSVIGNESWRFRENDARLNQANEPRSEKPDFRICENKAADQLCGNRTTDQRLCFRYMDNTIPLLP